MQVCTRRSPHRRWDRSIGLPPGTSARSTRPTVAQRMGDNLHRDRVVVVKAGAEW